MRHGWAVLAALGALAPLGCSSTSSGPGGDDSGTAADAVADRDASLDASDAAQATDGGKAFGETCAGDGECASGACFIGGGGGGDGGANADAGAQAYCSLHCDSGAQCPTPPTGGFCNSRGYCRK